MFPSVLVILQVRLKIQWLPEVTDDIVHGWHVEVWNGEARGVYVQRRSTTWCVNLAEIDDKPRKENVR